MRQGRDVRLAPYSSFNIGGPAREVYWPESREELTELLDSLRTAGSRSLVFGCASNVVFPDVYLDAAVIFTTELRDIAVYSDVIAADCGVTLSRVAITAQHSALEGAEFLYGIPGSVGGAVVMNAGAYSGEIADIFTGATVYRAGALVELKRDDLCFGYRKSALQDSDDVVVSARFLLREGETDAIRAKMDDYMERRKSKQPLSYPSAGSVFRRPAGHYAGALIERAGLKGCSVGGAMVSASPAGFIVNTGVATQDDVRRLVDRIKNRVLADSGIELECEIKFVDA